MGMLYLEGVEDTEKGPTSLLALQLVSQVLDEAYIIASEVKESGEPWNYLAMLKSFKSASFTDTDEDVSYNASKGDDEYEHNNEQHSHVVATSTPQKDFDGNKKPKSEGNLIGQGDEDLELHQSEESQITSRHLSNILFDMSEVEKVGVTNDTLQESTPSIDILTAMVKIMDSCVDKACHIVAATKESGNLKVIDSITEIKEDYNDYSFLVDVFGSDMANNVAFYLDEASANNDLKIEEQPEALVEDDDDNKSAPPDDDQLQLRLPALNDTALYNIDAYLTLNRDYEQCSDDDGDPILQDPKGLSMHEIKLLTANTSLQELSSRPDLAEEPKQLIDAATSDVTESVAELVVKKTLGRRCRLRGARILACLRGWWRRRIPSKRKEPCGSRSHLANCPLSPEARQRRSATLTTSLMESRSVNSPQPSRDAWKFNTVSEALVNVSQWKDYVFAPAEKAKLNEIENDLV